MRRLTVARADVGSEQLLDSRLRADLKQLQGFRPPRLW
jgi:hypothetical protein